MTLAQLGALADAERGPEKKEQGGPMALLKLAAMARG